MRVLAQVRPQRLAQGWQDDKPKKTVFKDWLPIVPVLANFDVIDGKVIYYGAVEKLMDPQRVFNYTKSREVEEGALAPREDCSDAEAGRRP